jgi:hypothetical protein
LYTSAKWKVLSLFVGAADIPIRRHHGLDTVLLKELFHLPLAFWTVLDVCPHPAFQNRLGSVSFDDASHDLGMSRFPPEIGSCGSSIS